MESWQKKLPLWITCSRMVIGPALFLFLFGEGMAIQVGLAVTFIIASLTDYFDGYYARKFQAESTVGKFMDPIADKILVLAALLILLEQNKIDPVMVMLILSRDILIGGIRAIAAAEQIIIAAKAAGKWKTAIQMTAIPVLFVESIDSTGNLARVAYVTLWFSVILSLFSGWEYINKYLAEKKQQ